MRFYLRHNIDLERRITTPPLIDMLFSTGVADVKEISYTIVTNSRLRAPSVIVNDILFLLNLHIIVLGQALCLKYDRWPAAAVALIN